MIYLLFEHLLVLPSLRQLYQWGKPMGWLFFPYSFRAGYSGSQCWEELSTGEKRRVGQRQSDPDWASNELQCDTRQGGRGAGSELVCLRLHLTQSASWLLSLIVRLLCHSSDMLLWKWKTTLNICQWNVLEHHCRWIKLRGNKETRDRIWLTAKLTFFLIKCKLIFCKWYEVFNATSKLVLSLRKLDLKGGPGHVQLLDSAACELFQSRHSRASTAHLPAR